MIDSTALIGAVLTAAVLGAMPLILAALGEAIGESAGLLNLGIEGMLLMGAFTGFWIAYETASILLALVAAGMIGAVIGMIFGFLCSKLGADQVVAGLGFTLAGIGLTGFLHREAFGSRQPLLAVSIARPFNAWSETVPLLGDALLAQPWPVYAGLAIAGIVHVLLYRTTLGLHWRAIGESPMAADAAGLSIANRQMAAATGAGVLVGLAGASLATVQLGFFQPNVTFGTGFLAIAIAMLARRQPGLIVIYALLFGGLQGVGISLQVLDVSISTELGRVLPYVGIVLALVLKGRAVALPSALGRPAVPQR